MKYYYVDYENVNEDGLEGINQLGADCHVFLYWHKDAVSPSHDHKTKAKIKRIKINYHMPNAVDNRIAMDICDRMDSDRESTYYIISKDKDYNKFISDSKKMIQIQRVESIAESLPAPKQKQTPPKRKQTSPKRKQIVAENQSIRMWQTDQLLDRSLGYQYRDKRYYIWKAVESSKSQTQIVRNLMTIFGNIDDVNRIFTALQPLIKNMPQK